MTENQLPLYKESIFIHFDQADPAGILFFGEYFKIAHESLEHMMQKSPLGWAFWYNHSDWGVPLKHVEADFMTPLWAGQEYLLELYVKRVGDTSVSFQFHFKKDENLCALVNTTHVFLNKSDLKPRSIPPEIRDLLLPH